MVPRQLSQAMHTTKPKVLAHFNWLSLPAVANGPSKVLVVKGGLSGIVMIYPSATATADITVVALMEWFMSFVVVSTFVWIVAVTS
ncbi:hypothetical protein H310_06547 [Aphanomyces invadans]|uniref:Uncharacterized protein n=1 Tax=Aphanomyces invadans TaxID=157072 RepID=A0A024U743_9STRA|nr:hypothetical protein H310_06547 [Aphanomyces invadans]ETW02035.1 hypothetical protein H310_06547 [Aphanomyces invadans]|eukprot:XP_008869883.1 hypothetical protein H310_06547 [Aphanomyces invadans]